MISSQIGVLDKIFSGGLKNGIITEISGSRGTGKTHLALQFAIEPLSNNKKILFVDTTVEFRPERFLQIIQSKNLSKNLLNNLHISRVTNTQEQIEILNKIPQEHFSLLIVDNVTDLFAFEYAKREHIIKKNNNFANYMIRLSKIALLQNIPIIITNQLLQNNEKNYQRMNIHLENYIHQKIELEKIKNNFKGKISSPFINNIEFSYSISSNGIEET